MKISIIYFSKSGKTTETAMQIANAISENENLEVKLFNIENGAVDYEFVKESKAVIFGSPTYMANACSEMVKWFESKENCTLLTDKLGAAFATAQYQQGGAEIAVSTINNFMLVHGMLVYAGGGAMSGKPMTHLGVITLNDRPEVNENMSVAFGQRIAKKVIELF